MKNICLEHPEYKAKRDMWRKYRDLYAGGRVSFAVAPNANLYVKGGYTNARFKATAGSVSESANFDGYRLGAGGQLGIGGKAYVGGGNW